MRNKQQALGLYVSGTYWLTSNAVLHNTFWHVILLQIKDIIYSPSHCLYVKLRGAGVMYILAKKKKNPRSWCHLISTRIDKNSSHYFFSSRRRYCSPKEKQAVVLGEPWLVLPGRLEHGKGARGSCTSSPSLAPFHQGSSREPRELRSGLGYCCMGGDRWETGQDVLTAPPGSRSLNYGERRFFHLLFLSGSPLCSGACDTIYSHGAGGAAFGLIHSKADSTLLTSGVLGGWKTRCRR